MKSATSHEKLERELVDILAPKFPSIKVDVAHSEKWNRPCVAFTCRDFAGLLPEERFHRLVAVIPTEFREEKLAGFVWLELVEGESVESFLKLPRSEDIANREAEIYKQLIDVDFFESLAEKMGASPDKRCSGGFGEMARELSDHCFSSEQVRDAKLLMIRHRAFCDCQILLTAMPELATLLADEE
jgi:hypothetical protein